MHWCCWMDSHFVQSNRIFSTLCRERSLLLASQRNFSKLTMAWDAASSLRWCCIPNHLKKLFNLGYALPIPSHPQERHSKYAPTAFFFSSFIPRIYDALNANRSTLNDYLHTSYILHHTSLPSPPPVIYEGNIFLSIIVSNVPHHPFFLSMLEKGRRY